MSKSRRWLIGGLALSLVVTIVPAAHAQQSPTETFPAPEHLATLLPDIVEGEHLYAFGVPPGTLSEQVWMSMWVNPSMNILPRLGKTPADMRLAMASDLGDPPLTVLAVQVASIPADDVAQAAIQGFYDAAEVVGSTLSPTFTEATEDFDGDEVRVLRGSETRWTILFYPVGETLFIVFMTGLEDVGIGRSAELLSSLRDAVALAGLPSTHPPTRRFALSDIGIAVTLPGDWREIPVGVELDEVAHIFFSPDGFFRYCTFAARSFEGRVTADFVEDIASPALVDPKAVSRVQTDAGEALWMLEQQTENGFIPGLASTGARYLFPAGDSMITAGCSVAHGESQEPAEDWRQVVDTIEFLDTGHTVAEATLATRDLVCSILVARPESTGEAKRSLRELPRPSLTDVRNEVRRFLRRHGQEVLGSDSPGTMVRSGELTYSSAWSSVPFVRAEVDRSLKELGGSEQKARRAANRLLRWIAGAYGTFDDAAIRRDAHGVSEVIYHYGVTGLRGDKAQHWDWMNSSIDVNARVQGFGSCFEPREEAAAPSTPEDYANPISALDEGSVDPGASDPTSRSGEGLTIGYITTGDLPWTEPDTIKAGMISAADTVGARLLVCQADIDRVHACAEEMKKADLDGVIQNVFDFKPKRTCRALEGIPTIVVGEDSELGLQDCWTALIGPDSGEAGRLVGDAIGRYASERWSCEFDAFVAFETKPGNGPIGAAIAKGVRDGFIAWCPIPRDDEHVYKYSTWTDRVLADKVQRMARRVQGDRLVIVGSTYAIGFAEQALAVADRKGDGYFSGVGVVAETPHAIACDAQFIAAVDPIREERYADLAMTAMVDHLRGEEIPAQTLTEPRVIDASTVRDIYPDIPSC